MSRNTHFVLLFCVLATAQADTLDIVVNINGVNISITEEMFKNALPKNISAVSFDDSNASVAQQVCPTGFYCPFNTDEPKACPSSTFQPTAGQTKFEDCVNCTEGSYCPSAGASAQIDCPLGHRCPTKLMTSPDICPLGYYQGSVRQAICEICPAGRKCNTTGMSAPLPCSAGKYQPQQGQTSCIICPQGQICDSETTVNPTNCSAGTYSQSEGNTIAGHCLSCLEGHYCPEATINPIPCPSGTYRTGVGAQRSDQCAICPAGKWCGPAATAPTSCAAGKYRKAEGATEIGNCLPCPAGQWCGSATSTPTNCTAGTFRQAEGAASAAECANCPAGSWCGEATVIPTACVAGTYRQEERATMIGDCLTCSAGYWCTTTAVNKCAAGTFRVETGASTAAHCVSCAAGTFETSEARTSVCPACPINNYCPTVLLKKDCPVNTVSEASSTSQLSCRCKAGFVCFYTKQIQAVVTLNSTETAFNSNADNVRENFLAAIAAAAGVDISKVTIVSVSPHQGSGRRLLGHHEGIEVVAVVEGAHTLSNIETHVRHRGIHLHSHSWRESHSVRTHFSSV